MRPTRQFDLVGSLATRKFPLEPLQRPVNEFVVALKHRDPQHQCPVIGQRNRPSQSGDVERALPQGKRCGSQEFSLRFGEKDLAGFEEDWHGSTFLDDPLRSASRSTRLPLRAREIATAPAKRRLRWRTKKLEGSAVEIHVLTSIASRTFHNLTGLRF